jgi:anti-anti-sigma factor
MQANVIENDTAGQVIIKLQGRFDFNAHKEFREAIDIAVNSKMTEVRLDLTSVDYLDSSALGMLLLLRDRVKSLPKDLAISSMSVPVKQVLEIANFSKLFKIL